MRHSPTLYLKKEPVILPDRAIRRQSHYFIYRPRVYTCMCIYIYIYIYTHAHIYSYSRLDNNDKNGEKQILYYCFSAFSNVCDHD